MESSSLNTIGDAIRSYSGELFAPFRRVRRTLSQRKRNREREERRASKREVLRERYEQPKQQQQQLKPKPEQEQQPQPKSDTLDLVQQGIENVVVSICNTFKPAQASSAVNAPGEQAPSVGEIPKAVNESTASKLLSSVKQFTNYMEPQQQQQPQQEGGPIYPILGKAVQGIGNAFAKILNQASTSAVVDTPDEDVQNFCEIPKVDVEAAYNELQSFEKPFILNFMEPRAKIINKQPRQGNQNASFELVPIDEVEPVEQEPEQPSSEQQSKWDRFKENIRKQYNSLCTC